MKYVFRGISALVIAIVFAWTFSVLKCEYFTWKYGTEFIDLDNQIHMIDDIEKVKILDYSDSRAEVYYIDNGGLSGDVVVYEKMNDSWQYVHWKTVWSRLGSADGYQWPYIFDNFL